MTTKQKSPSEYFKRKSELLNAWENYPKLMVAGGYYVDLIISREEGFDRNLEEPYWSNVFLTASWQQFVRAIKCSVFNLFTCLIYPALKFFVSKEEKLVNLLGSGYEKLTLNSGVQIVSRDGPRQIGWVNYFLWRRCISVGLLETTSVILSSCILLWLSRSKSDLIKSVLEFCQRSVFSLTEKSLEVRVSRIARHMQGFKICAVLQSGDSSIAGAICCLSQKKHGGVSISFTHGYVWCIYGASIIPSCADVLICWSEKQKDFLTKLTVEYRKFNQTFDTKIEALAPPKKSPMSLNTRRENGDPLIVLLAFGGYLKGFLQNPTFAKHLTECFKALEAQQCRVWFTVHPHERNCAEVLRVFSERFPTGNIRIGPELERPIDVLVGASTSLFFEAIFKGIPVIQIRELKFPDGMDIEEAPEVFLRDFSAHLSFLKDTHDDYQSLSLGRKVNDDSGQVDIGRFGLSIGMRA